MFIPDPTADRFSKVASLSNIPQRSYPPRFSGFILEGHLSHNGEILSKESILIPFAEPAEFFHVPPAFLHPSPTPSVAVKSNVMHDAENNEVIVCVPSPEEPGKYISYNADGKRIGEIDLNPDEFSIQ